MFVNQEFAAQMNRAFSAEKVFRPRTQGAALGLV